ncbi:uncharacterized protein SCHCODRAFT_01169158 [Schizophyllum commune H4-8]|nr:uncharacterized protein SCHCODRAFT_01169158 [Schizophyllum commune H4-8]KAI5894462.1 hypothetical protein SCHCODRAFT_01169158 [Schizophyllum commune H4-8]
MYAPEQLATKRPAAPQPINDHRPSDSEDSYDSDDKVKMIVNKRRKTAIDDELTSADAKDTITPSDTHQVPSTSSQSATTGVHASQSSSAAAHLIEAAEDEKRAMDKRWESGENRARTVGRPPADRTDLSTAVANGQQGLECKTVAPAGKLEGNVSSCSDCIASDSAKTEQSEHTSRQVLHTDLVTVPGQL